ncbi:MAG: hypothetical protein J7494_02315 [Sphingobium sp.]|nr:hypothetical protein [Sphingobium sp.]
MLLRDIAHARAGDKGDTAQICVFAYEQANFPVLLRTLTAQRVIAHFAGLNILSVDRYEVPNLAALNFVLHGALSGGVTRSLALDAHGKTLGAQLLSIEIDRD